MRVRKGELVNILITAGGTREDIDPVRGITNYSTGRLGGLIAERYIESGAAVTYICGETAEQPQFGPGLEVIKIRNTAQLLKNLEASLYARPYDVVIHSMAVSDYAPCDVSGEKISSDAPYLVVVLKRQPKVIQRIKEIQPGTVLVGFKLVAGADEKKLLQAANKLMAKSRADFVLANALEDITGGAHKATFISRGGVVAQANTKEEIAGIIYENCNFRHHRQYRSV
jgi:phosphopantothenate-cysteine ligase